jgi:hypothetical protein
VHSYDLVTQPHKPTQLSEKDYFDIQQKTDRFRVRIVQVSNIFAYFPAFVQATDTTYFVEAGIYPTFFFINFLFFILLLLFSLTSIYYSCWKFDCTFDEISSNNK